MGIQIEGTPEFQRGFDSVCPDLEGRDASPYTRTQDHDTSVHEPSVHNRTVDLTRQIMQSVIAENPYKKMDLEWSMWDAVRVLEDQNGLPDGVTAEDVYQMYLKVFHGGDYGAL
jgi:hypothetical protein